MKSLYKKWADMKLFTKIMNIVGDAAAAPVVAKSEGELYSVEQEAD
ncbi:hypothetical protein [Clostridium vitabionis]|nr:hypothetical protein [Clostridium vitabionis]